MARAKLEYDDSGSTFYYFIISFYLLILIPVTYFLKPKGKQEKKEERVCQCEPCLQKKILLDREKPNETFKNVIKVTVLCVLWGLFFYMLYKVATTSNEYQEYDPFEILQIDPSASMSEIKKQYRKLSKVFHPDKQGGDQDMFMKIAKAYEALTDDVSRENWEKYGNPDGPQAAIFGIALPAWIVEKDNSVWVLVAYMSVFAVALPLVVGVWWYRSIKYGSTNLLLQTSQIFQYFIFRSKAAMNPKRVIMIVTAAFEFNPDQSPLVKLRPTDDFEIGEVILSKSLPLIDIKTKEQPFCAPYAAKARILMHAHLERFKVRPDTLEIDQHAILKVSPRLIQELLTTLTQFWYICKQQRYKSPPTVDVFECVMSCSQMVVQGMWAKGSSPILQLPHIRPEQLKHFKTKKRQISSIDQFVAMKSDDRRLLVRALSDEEYYNVMAACSMFPRVTMTTDLHVVDDYTSKKITAKSVLTLSVTLNRVGLLEHYKVDLDNNDSEPLLPMNGATETEEVETLGARGMAEQDKEDEDRKEKSPVPKSWEKNKKKRKGKPPPKKKTTNPKKAKKTPAPAATPEPEVEEEVKEDSESDLNEVVDESDSEPAQRDEEKEWDRLQKNVKKQKELAQTPKDSHPVHAPYFPTEKLECWWLYIVDRRRREVISPPQRIVGLKTTYSTDLQFPAPEKPGPIRYSIVLTSDSYIDLSFQTELKVMVHPSVEVKGTDQWKDLEEEEEEDDVIEETESEDEQEETEPDTD